jgi:hypothetical protein
MTLSTPIYARTRARSLSFRRRGEGSLRPANRVYIRRLRPTFGLSTPEHIKHCPPLPRVRHLGPKP